MHLRSRLQREWNQFRLKTGCSRLQHLAVALTVFANLRVCPAQSIQSPVLVPHKSTLGDFAAWPKIRLDMGFFDGKSNSLSRPSIDQLLVVEDGMQQANVTLQELKEPASICLLVDQSGSMKKNGQTLLAAVKQLILTADPTDEIAVLAFDKSVYLEQGFTDDSGKLVSGLQRVGFGGPSSFFDAVWVAIDQLATRAPERRKILVIFSDGDDNYSRVQFGDLLRRLQYPGAPLIDSLTSTTAQNVGANNLQAISERTGGFVFTSEHLNELRQDICNRQTLQYISTHSQRDGKLHKVEIRLVPGINPSKMKPYFRREYYAPSN
jgi:VWFA-related protein